MRADQIGPYASHMLNSVRLLLPDILWQSMHSLKCKHVPTGYESEPETYFQRGMSLNG